MVQAQSGERRMAGVYDTVNFLAVYGTLFFLGMVAVWLVIRATEGGSTQGVRSFAGVLFPPVIGSFVYLFQREHLARLAALGPAAAFLGSVGAGLGVMAALKHLTDGATVPLAELIVAGCFSVLVFSSRSLPEKNALAYYYGVLCGMLLYVILFGFPLSG